MMRYSGTYWDDVENVVECIPNISEMYRRSVLLTGATGMIGSAVAELLFHLNRTRDACIQLYLAGRSHDRMEKRFYPFSEGTDYTFIQYDATEYVPLAIHSDYIIHGASNASPVAFRTQPVETMLSNFLGLKCLLDIVVKTQAKRLLYISSSEVYGKKSDNRPYSEEDYGYVDILNPRAAYPSSKRAAETLCAAYGAQFGVDTVIVRPGHIYGPTMTDTDDRASAQFTRAAIRGEPIVMKSAGNQLRSYCYSLDCASAILTVLINGEKGQAYNISNKDSVISIREIAEAMAQEAGTKVEFITPSDDEIKGYNMMDNSALTSDKLDILGWRGMFDLRQGVRKTLRILRES